MSHNAKTADFPRCSQCRAQSEEEQRSCVASALMIFVDRELSKERSWNWVWFVALLWFGEKGALNLRRAQGDVTHDFLCGGVANNVGARDAGGVIGPGMPPEPLVQ